ncbi:invasion associated locus B family protein [Rhodoplanes serenus]|uniref:invasion associated locus B family protein n=1 Tax=Rhodoplanes serenus TaxID=200615 RepID=UPI000DAC3A2E|nr:invasion associated locus B family protein [Rhodoplanes serenus]RAI32442.1 hypothetical protein CH340_15480 [Rhodoplanes serenus]
MSRSSLSRLFLSRLLSKPPARRGRSRAAVTLVAALAMLAAGPAAGQSPTRTTATYDDWTVRCETPPATPPATTQKICEIFQTQQLQGQAVPTWQVAIGRAAKADPLRLVVQMPVNVWLAAAPRLVLDDKQSPLALAHKRCMPAGCFADAELGDDMLRRLRARTEPGRIEYKDAIQRDVAVPLSFKGFAAALDALAKQ